MPRKPGSCWGWSARICRESRLCSAPPQTLPEVFCLRSLLREEGVLPRTQSFQIFPPAWMPFPGSRALADLNSEVLGSLTEMLMVSWLSHRLWGQEDEGRPLSSSPKEAGIEMFLVRGLCGFPQPSGDKVRSVASGPWRPPRVKWPSLGGDTVGGEDGSPWSS